MPGEPRYEFLKGRKIPDEAFLDRSKMEASKIFFDPRKKLHKTALKPGFQDMSQFDRV